MTSAVIILDFHQAHYSAAAPGEYGISGGTIAEIIYRIMGLRNVDITTEKGLTEFVRTILDVADMSGLPDAYINKLKEALDKSEAFALFLAVVRYLHMLLSGDAPRSYEYSAFPIAIEVFQYWLAVAQTIFDIWRSIRKR